MVSVLGGYGAKKTTGRMNRKNDRHIVTEDSALIHNTSPYDFILP